MLSAAGCPARPCSACQPREDMIIVQFTCELLCAIPARDQRRGKLHRHSLSLSVTPSTDETAVWHETSRQAFIQSGVTRRWRSR